MSGSPAPRSMIVRPDARIALARTDTAIVADSRSSAIFVDGANGGMTAASRGAATVGLVTADVFGSRLYFERPRACQTALRIDKRHLGGGEITVEQDAK